MSCGSWWEVLANATFLNSYPFKTRSMAFSNDKAIPCLPFKLGLNIPVPWMWNKDQNDGIMKQYGVQVKTIVSVDELMWLYYKLQDFPEKFFVKQYSAWSTLQISYTLHVIPWGRQHQGFSQVLVDPILVGPGKEGFCPTPESFVKMVAGTCSCINFRDIFQYANFRRKPKDLWNVKSKE